MLSGLTMLTTYNLHIFGKKIKEIRKSLKLTQQNITKITGIHPDTMRRLEKGQNIPTYETIEKLSLLFGVELLDIMKMCKKNISLNLIYNELDHFLLNNVNKEECLVKINDQLNEFIIESKKNNYIRIESLLQVIDFIDNLTSFVNRNVMNKSVIITKFKECFNITSDFNKISTEIMFSHLELRILLIISLLKMELDLYHDSNQLLILIKTCLERKTILTKEEQKIYIKVVCNISYNYHDLHNDKEALEYAEKGIQFCRRNERIYLLYLLYARSSISKKKLNYDNYLDDARNSICLLDMMGYHEMKELYKSIYKNEYNIIV